VSYTNGVGSGQQVLDATEVASSASADRTERTEQGPVSTAAQVGSGSAAPVDQANLSTTAGLVAQALSESDVRTDKVAALQQQIAAGTYNIPASDVADKLMSALLR
jgi:negative regulator of flagellin synthesis FlgM